MKHRPGRDPAAATSSRTFPYATPVGLTYDIGDYDAHLDKAMRDGRRRRLRGAQGGVGSQAASCAASATRATSRRAASRRRTSPARSARARACSRRARCASIRPARVTVFTGSHSHGQGHETTFAQVVAARLGIPVDNVEIVHGDTGRIPFGMGTYGSRSLAVGGTAIVKAVDKVIAKGKKIAAHLLEAADTDIEFENGEFKVAGTDKKVPWGTVSLTAYVPHNYPLDKLEPGLNENAFYDPTNFTYPAGTLHLRGRGRSGHGQGEDRVASSPSTTSATSSIR